MAEKLRYNSFSQHLKEQFGCRVHKISVDAGFTCPNRDGTKGQGGCIYCAEGSRAAYCDPELPIQEQVKAGMERMRRRFKAEKFIVYFQPYSNTYAPVEKLKELYDSALCHPAIIGLAVGTRPDCVSPEILNLLQDYDKRYYLWVEYGLQSVSEETLKFINRGHGVQEFIEAVKQTKERGIRVCAHVIIGLPDEDKPTMLASAKLLNELNVDGIKIHSLYISKGAPLAQLYDKGKLSLLSLEEYVELVSDYLEQLSPEILIHRVTGEAPLGELIAPQWAANKIKVINAIKAELKNRDSYQGHAYPSQSKPESALS